MQQGSLRLSCAANASGPAVAVAGPQHHPCQHTTATTPVGLSTQVDEEYLEALLLLGRKIAFLATNSSAAGSVAGKDVAAVLEKLRIRAIIKVRARASGWAGMCADIWGEGRRGSS